MLKISLIVVLAMTFVQVPKAEPHETDKANAQNRRKDQKQADGNQVGSIPLSANNKDSVRASSAPPFEDQLNAQGKEHSVKITGLPSVTLVDKQKTFSNQVLQWGPWAANFLLVFVGAGQVWLLWRTWKTMGRQADALDKQVADATKSSADAALVSSETLGAIKRQADLMETQTKEARAAADAALLNARAVINAERPWLLVSIDLAEGSDTEWVVRAVNTGNTPAELFEGHCSVKLHPAEAVLPTDIFDPFWAPLQTLFVKDDGFEIRRFPIIVSSVADRNILAPFVGEPDKFLYVYGKITYWDTFTNRDDPKNVPHITQWAFMFNHFTSKFHRASGSYTRHT